MQVKETFAHFIYSTVRGAGLSQPKLEGEFRTVNHFRPT